LIKEHGGNVYKVSRETGINIDEIIDFSANINPLGVPDSGRKALINAIDGLVNYPDPDYIEFRNAVAKHHKIDAWRIVPGNGAIDSLYSAVSAVEPKRVLVSVPSFVEYEKAIRKIGAEYIPSLRKEENGYRFELEQLLSEINANIDLVILCNPNNPTGDLVPIQDIIKILKRCEKCGAYLLLDEAFMEFAELFGAESAIDLTQSYPELIVSRSLTKFYAVPGLRSGYLVVGNEMIRNRILAVSEPWKLNHLADVFSRTVLFDTAYLTETKKWLLSENKRLESALSDFEWLKVYPSYANYLFLQIEKDVDLKTELLNSGIMIRTCHNYDGMGEGYYRVAVKDAKSNDKLINALNNINEM